MLTRFLDLKTNLFNVRDAVLVFLGFWQALWLLLRTRPKVIFIKGGFVAVPVGLAAAILRIPFLTHDSDTMPGLANRIIGRWAKIHATGMPAEFYAYPESKKRFTGIPIAPVFKPVDESARVEAKNEMGIDADQKVIVVTGGSQGSQRINQIFSKVAPKLLEDENVFVIHHVGKNNETVYGDYTNSRLRVEPFIEKFYQASAAADIIVARGGATNIAEASLQGKPMVLIPSPFLTGGHQLKNAEHLAALGAIISLDEAELLSNPELLLETLKRLLDNKAQRQLLAENLSKLSKPHASEELATLLLEIAK